MEKNLRYLIPEEFKVLSSDFEGVLRGAGFKAELEEARKKFPRSKVLQGRYVAITMQSIPEELKMVIDQVGKISRSY